MRYNRADIFSACNAAIKTGARYVYATALGFAVTDIRPPAGQTHYEIVDGQAILRAFRLRPYLTAGDIVYRLRQKRNAVVEKWAAVVGNDPAVAVEPAGGDVVAVLGAEAEPEREAVEATP